jgi:chemotaxis protein methyltransferase CheR
MDRRPDGNFPDDSGYEQLVAQVQRLFGIDLRAYKQEQMQRRITSLARRRDVHDLRAYARLIEDDPAERQRFLDAFTINVSEFFRDERPFRSLESEVLPRLLTERGTLRVWSAGCANGAELYSIGILLAEQGPESHVLLGSDIDATTLERARAGGPFGAQEIQRVAPSRLDRFLSQDANGEWWVQADLREHTRFVQHDLLRDPLEADFDLIACRNVVIYFTRDAKINVFARLAAALRPGGVLMVGGTEMIFHAAEIGLSRRGVGFYERTGTTAAAGS